MSKATAIHLDVFVPEDSYTADSYRGIGFGVVGAGRRVAVASFVERAVGHPGDPAHPGAGAKLSNMKGVYFITNSGNAWTGPIYVDSLRAVIPVP